MKKYLFILVFVLLTVIFVGSVQAEDRMYLEVMGCEWWKDSLIVGDQIAFQHGIGFGDYDTAMAERAGQDAFFLLDGEPLGPVYYEGLTEHSPGFFGDRARVDWDVKPGEHTIQSYWSQENEGYPGDTCTFKATKVSEDRDIFKVGTGERLFIPNGEGEITYTANTPFFIAHGWAFDLQEGHGRYIASSTLNVFVDGNLIEPDKKLMVYLKEFSGPDEDRLVKYYLYNFPEGMTGLHLIEVEYWLACERMSSECVDPLEPVIYGLKSWWVTFE